MKRTKRNKLLAVFLVLIMMMTMISTIVYAEDNLVSTEAQLKAAIENATGTTDNPTEIKIDSNIALTESLIIKDRNVKLLGVGNDVTISIGENFQYKSGTGVIYIENTGNEEMNFSFENLIIDGRGDGREQNWRLLATSIGSNITVNMNQSDNEKTELYGCITGSGALGNYSKVYGSCVCINGTFNLNGGIIHTSPFGIYILSNSTFNLNDGQIDASGCSMAYHGILFGHWQTDTSVNVNGGKIITSLGGRYGGAAISAITNFKMTGGMIQSSVTNDGQCYIFADNIRIGGGCVISGGGQMTAFNKAPQIISELSSANILVSQQNLGNNALVARSSDDYEIQESDLVAFHDWNENNMMYMQKDEDGKNAIYTATKKTIIFNNNGGSGNMDAQNIPSGIETKLTVSTFTRDGYCFTGWNTAPDGTGISYADGDSIILTEDITLYAKWTEKESTSISFKEDLAALIKYAQDAQNAENYKYLVPKVKELFEKALADAIAVNEKEDATQKEVEEAYDELLAKVHLLDFTGNTENLTVLVATAEGKNEELYTKESWEPFAEALQAAKELLKDPNALQAELDVAHDALQAAMDALIEKPIDTSKLEKLVAEASVYEAKIENYIPSTAESFMAALNGAREVLANSEISGSEITQDAVDSAYKTLLNAIFGLREVPNKDKLEELLGKVEAMDLSVYSEETANAVKAAVAMAEAVMEDENANQKQVDAAVAALEEAVAALESKDEVDDIPDASDSDKVDNDTSISDEIADDSKKDDSFATDNKVASNDEGSKDAANKTTTDKADGKAAAQTGDAAKAAIPTAAATAALLAVWFIWKKK